MTHFVPIERKGELSYAVRVVEALCVGPVGHGRDPRPAHLPDPVSFSDS